MRLAPSEHTIWANEAGESQPKQDDRAISERYTRGEGRIVTETNREKLPGFVELMKKPDYMELRPFYQRRPRWDVKRQSRLIESFIMNIPVPPVFLYERNFNSYEVMDGQQRITAIRNFYDNAFELEGLEMWPELNGRSYKTLPETIKAGIDRRSITSIVLLKESTGNEEEESLLRETVFERLNTGGIKLERQEIRNALYRSAFNDLVDELTRWDAFRKAWGLPLWVKDEIETNPDLLDNKFFSQMQDAELVVRFFALRHASHYRRGMQGFLDTYMRRAMRFDSTDIDYLRVLYKNVFSLAVDLYDGNVFHPFSVAKNAFEARPHKAFYDAVMVGLDNHFDRADELRAKKSDVIEATKNLFRTSDPKMFTGAANTKADVQGRIGAFSQMIASVLDA